MPRPQLAIGIDLGGTKLAAGLVSGDGGVTRRVRRDTPDDAESILAQIVDVVSDIDDLGGVAGLPVGLGVAAIVDSRGVARWGPHLPFADRPVRDELRAALDRWVAVDNDANVAAWGEYRVGAGVPGTTSLLMLTLGTGVGGGLVLDGRLIRGAQGFAGEFGHVIVDEGGPACGCGNRGCLEALASGTAIGRRAREALTAGAASVLRGVQEVTGEDVTAAARAGDTLALEVLARCGFWLGVGIASLVNALDPEIVVVGGGAMRAGELLLSPARTALAARLMGRGHRIAPPVVRARLGGDAGLVGAALLALEQSNGRR
ncbi:MAG: ROK family protein [Egibacteraceae bacterium]